MAESIRTLSVLRRRTHGATRTTQLAFTLRNVNAGWICDAAILTVGLRARTGTFGFEAAIPITSLSATFSTVSSRSQAGIRSIHLAPAPCHVTQRQHDCDLNIATFDEMANNPRNMLQKLVEVAADLCGAGTAGISLLDGDVFRREAVAGTFANARGGTIITKTSRDVLITVSDTGNGLPAEQLMNIFQPFTQLDTSSRARAGGLGLGLPLVRSAPHVAVRGLPTCIALSCGGSIFERPRQEI